MPAKGHTRKPHSNANHPHGTAGVHIGQVDHSPATPHHRGQGSRRKRGRNYFGNPNAPGAPGHPLTPMPPLPPPGQHPYGGQHTEAQAQASRSSWR